MNGASNAWFIEFSSEEMREPLQVRVKQEVILGRSDPELGDHVDVDLAPYGGEKGGVSRRHLRVFVQDNLLMLEDLGSGNGTRLNGTRLQPSSPYPLGHVDQLRVGTLDMEVRVVAAPSAVAPQPSKHQTQLLRYGNGELIQIVEDHVELSQLFSLSLQKQGFAVVVSRDNQRAIRQFEQQRPDAILLDLMLPDGSGLQYCEYVRQQASKSELPIIIVSALKLDKFRREAHEAGANLYLAKPIQTGDLGDQLAQVLAQRNTADSTQGDGGGNFASTRYVSESVAGTIVPDISDNTLVVVIAGFSDYPMTLTLRRPMSFGRQAPPKYNNHINLSRFNAAEMGVSRAHFFVQYHQGNFFVEDANSTNGTYLEGKRLTPSKPTRIRNGDEIRAGQLRMYAFFLPREKQPQQKLSTP